jgi:hypothetical protein
MTRNKDFKRAVRDYASRTGRSYAGARSLLVSRSRGDLTMNDVAFQSISRPELGFIVAIPQGWSEFPPILSNSPYEVARFAYRDHAHHIGIVFRMPGSPGLNVRVPAEEAQARQRQRGFGNFVLDEVHVGGRPGVRLTFEKTTAAGPWAAREYFVAAASRVYVLGLASGDPKGDEGVFESMASRFEVND